MDNRSVVSAKTLLEHRIFYLIDQRPGVSPGFQSSRQGGGST